MTAAPALNGHRPSPLTEIEDPVAFAGKALADELQSRGAWLPASKREECVSFLYERLVILALRFDPYGIAAVTIIRERIRLRTATRDQWKAAHRYVRERRRLSKLKQLDDLEAVGHDLYRSLPALGLPYPDRLPGFSKWAYTILRKRYTDWLRETRGDTRYGEAPMVEALDDALLERLPNPHGDVEASLATVRLDRLTPEGRETYRLAFLLQTGHTLDELAERYAGISRREIEKRLVRLRDELQAIEAAA